MRRLIILFAILCASCSGYAIKPYKMDIQQGNVVTSKMMLQLRPGMTKSQVRFIMGTPLIADSFHKDRWDYFYQMRKDGKIIEQRRVILEFEKDALKRVRGDVIPAGSGEAAAEPGRLTPPKEEEKGLLDRLKFWKKDEKPVEQQQAAPAELVKPEVAPKAAQPVAPELVNPESKEAPAAPADTSPDIAFPKPKSAAEMLPGEQPSAPAPAAAKPAPRPVVERAPEPSAPAPAPEKAAPAKAEEVKRPVVSEPAPEPKKATEAPAKPVEQPRPQPPAKVEAKSAQKPAAEPAVEDDLPPEEDPGYFEKMLEKIGF